MKGIYEHPSIYCGGMSDRFLYGCDRFLWGAIAQRCVANRFLSWAIANPHAFGFNNQSRQLNPFSFFNF
jgi:hypothetical protein